MKIFKIVLFSALALALLGEAYLRIFETKRLTPPSERALVFQPDTIFYNKKRFINYMYIPNSQVVFNNDTVYINSHGHIDRERIGAKQEGRLRIAFLGSSHISGAFGLPFYTCFVDDLRNIFRENGYNVEIINCGTEGVYRSYYQLITFKKRIMDVYDPDLVFAEYLFPLRRHTGYKDVYNGYIMHLPGDAKTTEYLDMKKSIIDDVNKYKPYLDFLYNSYIMRLAIRYYINNVKIYKYQYLKQLLSTHKWRESKTFPVTNKITEKESLSIYRNVRKQIEKNGGRFFLFDIEKPDSSLVVETVKKHSLPLISLNLTFDKSEMVPFDHHRNSKGNRKIAERFYELLTKYNVVGPEYKITD